jgi:hypothetical protein
VGPADNFIGVYKARLRSGLGQVAGMGWPGRFGGRSNGDRRIVGLKYIETHELLVQHGERLELLCLGHLRLEPCLDLILFHFFQIGVEVVDVAGDIVSN